MLIGEISKLTGFSKDTIRFYEKQKLITLGKKQRRENNYKDYSAKDLKRLLMIKRLKGFGFTLNETSDLLALSEENAIDCHGMRSMVDKKVKLINEKIRELLQIKSSLLTGVANCKNKDNDEPCEMLELKD